MMGWIACVVTGQHHYTVWSAAGRIFLRCTSCGSRSKGVAVVPPMTALGGDTHSSAFSLRSTVQPALLASSDQGR